MWPISKSFQRVRGANAARWKGTSRDIDTPAEIAEFTGSFLPIFLIRNYCDQFRTNWFPAARFQQFTDSNVNRLVMHDAAHQILIERGEVRLLTGVTFLTDRPKVVVIIRAAPKPWNLMIDNECDSVPFHRLATHLTTSVRCGQDGRPLSQTDATRFCRCGSFSTEYISRLGTKSFSFRFDTNCEARGDDGLVALAQSH